MSDPKAIIDEFCMLCEQVRMEHDLYASLIDSDQHSRDLCTSIAPMFFNDLCSILCDHMTIQFCRITDPARTGKYANLTSNYIVEELSWPDAIRHQLREINNRLMAFRELIEPARSKRVVHVDLSTQIDREGPLGAFSQGLDRTFLQDLQEFINIAYGYHNNGAPRPIAVSMSTDTHQLLRAIRKSVIYDQCGRCSAEEKTAAILDYEARL